MKLKINIAIVEDLRNPMSASTLYEREVDWPAVPPVGASVQLIGEEGWSEEVYQVWWDVVSGEVIVEMGSHDDLLNEGLEESLLHYGWNKSGSE